MELPSKVNEITAVPFLTWTVCLAKLQPRRTIVVVLCVLIAGISGFLVVGPLSGLITVLVLLGALSEFLAPVRCTLTQEYAEIHTITNTKRIMWSEAVGCAYSDQALRVSTVTQTSPLFSFRGITMHYGQNREEVLDYVRRIRSVSE